MQAPRRHVLPAFKIIGAHPRIQAKQVTDTYLLALAVANGGRFVTVDQSITLSAVPGAGTR